jgi:hypothetical protein
MGEDYVRLQSNKLFGKRFIFGRAASYETSFNFDIAAL